MVNWFDLVKQAALFRMRLLSPPGGGFVSLGFSDRTEGISLHSSPHASPTGSRRRSASLTLTLDWKTATLTESSLAVSVLF